MDPDLILRWLHVIGACVLLGTGAGIAFFMLVAHRTGDARFIAQTAGTVVLADLVFTVSAVVLQPVTGELLAWRLGWPLTEGWILASLVLYVVAGVFWLPVVWIQVRLRGMAQAAAVANAPLPRAYHHLFRIWFVCGFPAFAAVLIIIWLMIARPSIGWV
ncbi:putative integral membrane protein [Ruegeria denitrificans]|uniref:Putative integral membrane protein n=1 Tax=Ruegeria denitrificans TaxID=1715692 RepID=A0A0P1IGW7_9RHOB|nr:DUF2269 domain-containing protein [Ruegeria denitrificans]CUK12387.1 putative integral membrane protein [Ruegeria denitrificans]